jgi:hypothetical protein
VKKVVANKLKDLLLEERRNAAVQFGNFLEERLLLRGGLDIEGLYNDFIRLNPNKLTNDYLQRHRKN